MIDSTFSSLIVRGRLITVDECGRICLNDLHSAAHFTKNKRPHDWARLAVTSSLIFEVLRRITGKSRNYAKREIKSVLCTKRGANGGTYAHRILALSYAEYLSPNLAYEVRDVFLRYRAGDAELADEVLERASPDDNRRTAIRALARAGRNEYTADLKEHGVRGRGYSDCTDELYRQLFDGDARKLRAERFLPPRANMRDNFDPNELSYVLAGESLAKERVEEEDSRGNWQCQVATGRSARNIRQAIDADRKDRKRR